MSDIKAKFTTRPQCPVTNCGSMRTRYRERTDDWRCDACGCTWTMGERKPAKKRPEDKPPAAALTEEKKEDIEELKT